MTIGEGARDMDPGVDPTKDVARSIAAPYALEAKFASLTGLWPETTDAGPVPDPDSMIVCAVEVAIQRARDNRQ
jgi:hypothetical protein